MAGGAFWCSGWPKRIRIFRAQSASQVDAPAFKALLISYMHAYMLLPLGVANPLPQHLPAAPVPSGVCRGLLGSQESNERGVGVLLAAMPGTLHALITAYSRLATGRAASRCLLSAVMEHLNNMSVLLAHEWMQHLGSSPRGGARAVHVSGPCGPWGWLSLRYVWSTAGVHPIISVHGHGALPTFTCTSGALQRPNLCVW